MLSHYFCAIIISNIFFFFDFFSTLEHNRPVINKQYYDKYIKNVQNKFIPFYLGKTESSLAKRLNEHFGLDNLSKSTYALKLNILKKDLSDYKFMVCYYELNELGDDLNYLIDKIEKYLHNNIKPICGTSR
ncbi:MAG: hypothetical protein ACK5LY_08180 [Lachnospirales bacterium]